MKYLKLDLEGGEFIFRAREYSIDEDMRQEWCLIDLVAQIDTADDHTDMTGSRVSSKIDIRIENDESLTCSELCRLEETIDEALSGKADGGKDYISDGAVYAVCDFSNYPYGWTPNAMPAMETLCVARGLTHRAVFQHVPCWG